MEKKIKNCKECMMYKSHYGHGECWNECSHPSSPESYGSIIHGCQESCPSKPPEWCPLRKMPIMISLEE